MAAAFSSAMQGQAHQPRTSGSHSLQQTILQQLLDQQLTYLLQCQCANSTNGQATSYIAEDRRREISYTMAATWPRSVNFSLWLYTVHDAMQFHDTSSV